MRPGPDARHVHHATPPAALMIKFAALARVERSEGRTTSPIVHTVEVEHLHLAQFGLAGPTLALKVEGACHTLSATQLSEVALRHTCTESNQEKVHT